MAEGRNFETLVQNEGLDPIGEIQTRILYIYIYIYTYKHFSYRMNIHLPAIWKFRPGVEGFDGFWPRPMRCCAAASGQSPCLCGAASTSKRSQRTLQVCDHPMAMTEMINRLKGKSIGNQRKPWYKSMIFYDFLCISDEIYWNMRFWEMIITLWHHEHVGFCFWLSIVPPRPLKASGWKSPLRMRILGGSHGKHGASIFAWYMYI